MCFSAHHKRFNLSENQKNTLFFKLGVKHRAVKPTTFTLRRKYLLYISGIVVESSISLIYYLCLPKTLYSWWIWGRGIQIFFRITTFCFLVEYIIRRQHIILGFIIFYFFYFLIFFVFFFF